MVIRLFRLPDDFEKPEFATVNIQRDLFYGYDTLMENVSDPSHIDFAHHKVRIIPLNMRYILLIILQVELARYYKWCSQDS